MALTCMKLESNIMNPFGGFIDVFRAQTVHEKRKEKKCQPYDPSTQVQLLTRPLRRTECFIRRPNGYIGILNFLKENKIINILVTPSLIHPHLQCKIIRNNCFSITNT